MNEKMAVYLGFKAPTEPAPEISDKAVSSMEKAVGGLMDKLVEKAGITSEPEGENVPTPEPETKKAKKKK